MLSQLLQEIVDLCGFGPSLELCRAYGGRSVTVPAKMPEMHPIAMAMGFKAARDLAARFGGETVHVPAERTAVMDVRNRQMVTAYLDGASVSELSRDYGLTRKRVTTVLDEAGVERRR